MLHNAHLEEGSFHWSSGPNCVFLIYGFTATNAEVRPLAADLHQTCDTVAAPLLPSHYPITQIL